MAEKKLTGQPRDETGKGAARKLRARGQVPAIMYGRGSDPVKLSVDSRELYHVLHTDAGMNVLIDLHVDGDQHLALAKEVQRDIVRGEFLHADFIKISRTEKITVRVPVAIIGDSIGVREGGVVEHHLWEIEVECLPTNVPESIEADITELNVNDSLKVSDLAIPDDVSVLTPEEESVVAVVPPPIMKLEEEEEAVEGEEGEEGVEGEEGAEGAVGEGAEGAPSEGGESSEGRGGGGDGES
jgi:large subunit ribosomal protein L25